MVALLLLIAAAAAPLSATPEMRVNIRCVALLGLVASGQERGTSWADLPRLKDDGGRYAGIVGEEAMKDGSQTREAIGDLILAEVALLRKAGPLPRPAIDGCITRMRIALAEDDR